MKFPTPGPLAAPDPGPAASPGERLLLQAIRGWAGLRARGERPHIALARALEAKVSSRATALMLAWIQAIESESVRPIEMQCADCGGASCDEQRLILACGMATVALEAGEELLSPLLRNPRQVMVLARALNVALSFDGISLPARLAATVVDPHVQAPRPTLH